MLAERDQGRALQDGLLGIGSWGNGDLLTVDLRDEHASVWYVSHDTIWEDPGCSVRAGAVRTFGSLAELLLRLVDSCYVPGDSYDAREFTELIRFMGGPATTYPQSIHRTSTADPDLPPESPETDR